MKTVLVVDDEPKIREVVVSYLINSGFRALEAETGLDAIAAVKNQSIDFVILDLMLPDSPGEEVCQEIRKISAVPILMLTAKVTEQSRINGLTLGADDYLIKPFDPRELIARVRAILRRTDDATLLADRISFHHGELWIDALQQEVFRYEEHIPLTPNEYKLLLVLARHPYRNFTRENLVEKVLGFDYDGDVRAIDQHIKNLRQKIEPDPKTPKIHHNGLWFGISVRGGLQMKYSLTKRLTLLLFAMAAGIMGIATVSLVLSIHRHFTLYLNQNSGHSANTTDLMGHLEQAVVQSILWTFVGTLLLAIVLSVSIAKRISSPLLKMKRAAEQMARGDLGVRTHVSGNDELTDSSRSLNYLAEQLHEQEQIRLMMTEDIAHELRTPLTTLKSHLQAIRDGIWDPSPNRISSCYEEVERLTHLVHDLEQLTMLDSPNFTLNRKPVEIRSVIKQSMDIVAASYMEKGVKLELESDEEIICLLDRSRFVQVLVNIFSNALKHTPEGGNVLINSNVERENEVLITVEDTGKGIAPSDLPYIFERLYRADKSRNRKTGGGGIGLAIVKKLVEAHRGQVWAENRQGAAFFIQLPKSFVE